MSLLRFSLNTVTMKNADLPNVPTQPGNPSVSLPRINGFTMFSPGSLSNGTWNYVAAHAGGAEPDHD